MLPADGDEKHESEREKEWAMAIKKKMWTRIEMRKSAERR